ncbi:MULTISPECIES: excinuclease ABC subunit B [Bacillus]|uniref:UvrABC system protein B n=1 Tax=Bacillus cereus (strain ATCC 14579 / DSM 31 / CCUG 7414 / JCM 2152 / NBRC 15305 / NCIMB 9373 / NCTC 2599 / NRRL B-3711) TaxID=226900 RepID=UVRB_BACCR|nr:excinuclease ABC subunit B [Bacillus cereus]Q815I3.1 RecName: Full=UvrABC system protein B; Short=Protein UvrB; AltName: Full=Excinuclease ABC subunit B [Bacillus cereus ATCC 14579]AAP12033.1 Excinuclease ABC subunit B [Bacillus cereus ATCC 14579]EEL08990.1 UvrABC system protein B [Bacillus cereus BDRD-Cer4]MCC3288427.1 excinuclease ABC subunit B [Bacillus cereus]MEB9997435.1 excinuclease ABC subunit B [Bacillus cereus]OOR44665.1 excinuclease ABC subunit B [Bacillus cereus]
MERQFEIVSAYSPQGDQPVAIEKLVEGINSGKKKQVLLGATGTGKTFTISNVIKEVQKPTLVMAHNKTLAGQLYSELKDFFPNNAVEYFVSYYDYYQPEAYVPQTDTFIEKDAQINDEIDKLRHSATSALFERDDVIIVASVSCIYGLGSPEEYRELVVSLRVGMEKDRNQLLRELVDVQYGRNDIDFKRGTFRVRGDVVEIFPASLDEHCIRIEFFGDEIDRIREVNALTGEVLAEREHVAIFPASHFVTREEKMKVAIENIEKELEERLKELNENGKLLEAQRIEQRTRYDLEMMREMGFCSGIENYSRHLTLRPAGATPYTLLDYFPKDFLIVMDESHVSVPQVRAMYNGDQARKQVLVDHGFRLPSALDNRPLTFDEFEEKTNQVIYVSATPGPYELEQSPEVIEQIIRPTGLLDPPIDIRPIEGQIDDLLGEIQDRIAKNERVLITTLTKKMSEDLTDYLKDVGIKVTYLHSEIKTLERIEIIRDLRLGKFDVLVGINLLREGLDIPEVSLVAILDADKEGFLRSERSLIQTIGRAARNENGRVIMYADRITKSMGIAIEETKRRRSIQEAYNEEHGITPKTIQKGVRDVIRATTAAEEIETYEATPAKKMTKKEREKTIAKMEAEMKEAAKALDFERAAELRDLLLELKAEG